MARTVSFWRRRLVLPLETLVSGGISPCGLAWALAIGALIGSMPLAWGTTLLCFGAAMVLRLNPLAVQIGNLASWPLQIVLALPYFRLGEAWFGASWPSVGPAPGWRHLASDPLGVLRALVVKNGAALGAWALTAPLLLPLLYLAGRRTVLAARRRFAVPAKDVISSPNGISLRD